MSLEFRYRYLVALGSNMGERFLNLQRAIQALAAAGTAIDTLSQIYETTPAGTADRMFLNAVMICGSSLAPGEFMRLLLAVEIDLGRIRREKWGNRIIDLDLLLATDRCDGGETPVLTATAELVLPHPLMLERSFVLVPAAEIAPAWQHPDTARTLGQELAMRWPLFRDDPPVAISRSFLQNLPT